jgi:uncharacterized repeat protein (TIGR03803 family)
MKALILFLLFYNFATAQIQVIHHFEGGYKGSYPIGNLHLIGDVLYGCTFGDIIAKDTGNLFKIDTDGLVYESIFPFRDTLGNSPECMILQNNILYGNTKFGGKSEYGSLFKYDVSQSKLTNLFEFDKYTNNSTPDNKLVLLDSFLYGVAGGGSFVSDSGSLFKIKIDGTQYQKLFEFKNPKTQGLYPFGRLVRKGNVLYGATQQGGTHNYGVLYKIDLNGNNFKVLYNFDSFFNSVYPNATPILVDTWFYGSIGYNAKNAGAGIFYKVSINGNSFKIIDSSKYFSFSPNLVYKNGYIFSTTIKGGLYNKGSLFKLRVKDEVFTYLNDFNGYNGAEPIGELLLDDKFIYGSASIGGTKNFGTLFKFEYCNNPYKKEQSFLLNIGDSVRVNGKYYKKPTFFIDSLYTLQGCDSIIITKILSKSQLESIDEKELIEFSQKANQLIFHPKITTPYTVQIFNILGQPLLQNTNNSSNTIDISSLSKGIYYIAIDIANKTWTHKIIKD